ncbi:MAG: hypothetical protein AAF798_22650, partial [Bacteroidota bacterium]
MSVKNITIAYCQDNVGTADHIRQILQTASYQVQTLSCNKSTQEASLADQLLSSYHPILLLISDNFLKSAQCMSRGLKLLQEKSQQLIVVVVPGTTTNPQTGAKETVYTEFEKVSDIIQYINYWQDQYLDLRRQKRQLKDDEEGFDEERFNQHLKAVREISSQVGEFLRLVRSMGHHYLDQFQQNSYEELFKLLNDAAGWESVKNAGIATPPAVVVEEEATPPLDMSEIPGMNLLPN